MKKVCLTRVCPFCGRISQVLVNEEDYEKRLNGGAVQNCFPYLNATEREIIISRMCPTCQDDFFKEV